MRVSTMLAALATISCSATETNDNSLLTTGTWGGPDVQVTVTGQGTTTQFVCAHGTIDQLAGPDVDGNFTGTGTYVFEHPATVVGQPSSDSHWARYDGQLSARTMHISVNVADRQQVFGPFTATLGATGPSTRCQ